MKLPAQDPRIYAAGVNICWALILTSPSTERNTSHCQTSDRIREKPMETCMAQNVRVPGKLVNTGIILHVKRILRKSLGNKRITINACVICLGRVEVEKSRDK